jgi:iron complex transport system ATP-binding protein
VSAIAVSELTVRLGGRPVVDRVGLEVAEGEWLALIGPNGAGKTTLLRAVAGLVPFAGSVELFGTPAQALGRGALARLVALVPQEPSTPPWMTVAEYVLMGRTPHLGVLAREGGGDREAAARALARLDLLGYEERRLGTLSGGEKQRVVVARALAQEARVVLLDEPTAALDIGHQQQALELLDLLRAESGLTLVAAMHDLTLAAQYADRMVLLESGSVVADGAPAAVLTEAAIATHYGATIDVVPVGGRIAVVPRRAPAEEHLDGPPLVREAARRSADPPS